MELKTTTVPGQSTQFFMNLCPYPSSSPDTAEIRGHASNIQRLLQGTYDDIHPVFAQWTALEHSYDTADTEVALAALKDVPFKLGALRTAGDLIAMALNSWADYVDGYSPRRIDYLTDAQSVVEAYTQYQSLPFETRNAYELDNAGVDVPDLPSGPNLFADYVRLRDGVKRRGEDLQEEFSMHQETLKDSLKAIDIEKLAESAFTTRDAGLNVVDSSEELQYVLANSAAFGGQLDYNDVLRLSEDIDYNNLPYDFQDDEGRRWVMTEDGTMVRSGSPMDPYLESAILQAMADDPELSAIEPVLGEDADGNPVTASLEELGFGAAGAYGDQIPGVAGTVSGVGLTVLQTVALVPKVNDATLNATNAERSKYLLMSDDDVVYLEDLYHDREWTKAGAQTVASAGIGAAATAAAAPTYGTSYIIAYVVDKGTGEVIGTVVDHLYDDTQSEQRMYRTIEYDEIKKEMTPEEYAEAVRAKYNVVEPASGPAQGIEVVEVDPGAPAAGVEDTGPMTVTVPSDDGNDR